MWQDLFVVGTPILEKILRTIVVYLLVTIVFRLIGKRTIASMSTTDFVLLFLLSNVVQNAIIGPDNSLLGGAIGAVTLVLANAGFDWLSVHSDLARRILVGQPTTVVTDGEVDAKALDRIGLSRTQLEILIHQQDGDDISQIQMASMDSDGHLLVRIKPDEQSASHGDITALNERLDRIEALLRSR